MNAYAGIATADSDPSATTYWIVRRRDEGAAASPALVRVRSLEKDRAIATEFLSVPGLESAGQVSTLSVTASGKEPTLWIGGSRALLRVDAARLVPVPLPEATLMRRVEKNGSKLAPLAPGAQVVFDPDTERLQFEFSSTEAADGRPIAYRSRLLPVDSDWSPAQRDPRRSFTGLAAGSYIFEVRAVDHLGRAGQPATYPFILLAPWYRRTANDCRGSRRPSDLGPSRHLKAGAGHGAAKPNG